MFDLSKIRSIRISFDDFFALKSHGTNNPLAEEEIPELLKEAVKKGKEVLVTDAEGKETWKLVIEKGELKLHDLRI